MTYDSDYAYISVFIDFLERIIEIIKGLFSSASSNEDTEEDA